MIYALPNIEGPRGERLSPVILTSDNWLGCCTSPEVGPLRTTPGERQRMPWERGQHRGRTGSVQVMYRNSSEAVLGRRSGARTLSLAAQWTPTAALSFSARSLISLRQIYCSLFHCLLLLLLSCCPPLGCAIISVGSASRRLPRVVPTLFREALLLGQCALKWLVKGVGIFHSTSSVTNNITVAWVVHNAKSVKLGSIFKLFQIEEN